MCNSGDDYDRLIRSPSDKTNYRRSDWTPSQMYELLENLLSQRFNFFLILFSLFIAAAASCGNNDTAFIILIVGAILCLMISFTIYRTYVKHSWIINELYQTHTHPAKIVNDEVNSKKWVLFSVRRFIGWIIPLFCIIILFVGAILVKTGTISVASEKENTVLVQRSN